MARKKISQLPLATGVSGPDVFGLVQGGVTKRITASGMATFFGGGGGGGGPGSTGPTGPAGAASTDWKSTRLNSSHVSESRMPSSA